MPGDAEIRIERAVCRAMFVFDVGREIDLAAAKGAAGKRVRETTDDDEQRTAIVIDSPPLRLEIETTAAPIGDTAVETVVSVGVYDFGAIALTYALPVAGTLADLRDLSCLLAEDQTLAAQARRDVSSLVAVFGAAVADPALAQVTEEYLVFEITSFVCETPLVDIAEVFGQSLAQVLRAESQTLSRQEIAYATSARVTRTPDDLVLLDWNAALVFHGAPEDVREVLELANVQLLEMRFLDRGLDQALHRSYESVAERGTWRRPVFLPDTLRQAMRRIAQRQVDAAILYERVSNALKLVGDPHLARIYRRAARRFELAAWNAANLQKIATLESVYQKVQDRAAIVRAEMLEWIVILLIFAEIMISVFR